MLVSYILHTLPSETCSMKYALPEKADKSTPDLTVLRKTIFVVNVGSIIILQYYKRYFIMMPLLHFTDCFCPLCLGVGG